MARRNLAMAAHSSQSRCGRRASPNIERWPPPPSSAKAPPPILRATWPGLSFLLSRVPISSRSRTFAYTGGYGDLERGNRQARLADADLWPPAEGMPRPVGANGNAPVGVFSCRSHFFQGSGGNETQRFHLLRGVEPVERHFGKIRPHVDLVVLQVAAQRQHHIAGLEELAERGQDLATFAVARDTLPVRNWIARHGRNAQIGLVVVELPGMPQLVDAPGPDRAEDRLAHLLDRPRQAVGSVAHLRSGRERGPLFRAVRFHGRGLREHRGRKP